MSPMIIGGVVVGVIGALYGAYRSLVNKPHGKVEFKTGLVLRMIPNTEGNVDLMKLRKEYDRMGRMGSRRLKGKVEERNIMIPTRHGDVSTMAFISKDGADRPLILYFHAGGWCIGSIDSHRESCIRTCLASGMSVLAVDYSLGPEHSYPQPVEESIDVLEWVLSKAEFDFANSKEIILMGESAGGNMSIVLAHDRLKKDGAKNILEVIPIYAVTDCSEDKMGSFKDFESGYYLTKDTIDAFEAAYVKGEVDRESPWLSPLLQDDLKGFPDTYVITAEFDPLRDEGEAFGKKLQELGSKATIKRYDRTIHDFYGRAMFGKQGLKAVNELAEYLKKKYH